MCNTVQSVNPSADRDAVTGFRSSPHNRPLRHIRAAGILALALASTHCSTRALAPVGQGPRPFPSVADSPPPDKVPLLRVKVVVNGLAEIRHLSVEEYVSGSVPAEMPVGQPDPALADRLARLQAILARTYALANLGRHEHDGFDLCATTHCQVYRPTEEQTSAVAARVSAAVESTRGLVISDGQEIVEALFHADCGGHTSSATTVWGGPAPPYLEGVTDQFCVIAPRDDWKVRLERSHLYRILATAEDTSPGNRLDRLRVLERDQAGRVVSIEIVGERTTVVRGERFRAVVARQLGARSFRSTRFQIITAATTVEFTGDGFGHGVGLCQTGAIARARRGHTVEAILAHYYPGTTLQTVEPGTS